jgi:hypothetical protein
MAESSTEDHDQRLKVLLKEFFEQFFLCFFPIWAQRFDFAQVEWLDKELFLAPPQGERRRLDLVAKLRLKPDAPPPRQGAKDLVALVHVEVEERQSALALRPRMFEYYVQLERDVQLPVLPIGLFLRVGLEGIGWDAHEEYFWERRILCFEYAYVGLPALDAQTYVNGEHLLGVALSTLMRVPARRRAELYAEGLKRIATSRDNDYRRYLLAECLEAYTDLNPTQRQQFEQLLTSETYKEVQPIMITTFERGILEGERRVVLRLLEGKFGPLSNEVKQRVEALTPQELLEVQTNLLQASSLQALGLETKQRKPRKS